MKGFKLDLIVVLLLIVAFGLGFGWAASGRATAQQAVDEVKQQLDLADARGHILEARVSLYNVNFGDAQRQLDDAKAPLTRARDRAQAEKKHEAADSLSAALAHVQDAHHLTGRLHQNPTTQPN